MQTDVTAKVVICQNFTSTQSSTFLKFNQIDKVLGTT
jgi:hypothetical protein